MKSNLGGRADNWAGHPAGDSTSIAELKSVPGIVDRVPSTRGGGSGHTPPEHRRVQSYSHAGQDADHASSDWIGENAMANGDDDHMSDSEALERHIRSFVRERRHRRAQVAMVGSCTRSGCWIATAFALPLVEGAGHRVAQMAGLEDKPEDR